MDYQLVLQFRGNDLLDFDALVNLEDKQELIQPMADGDGLDLGSGEANEGLAQASVVA